MKDRLDRLAALAPHAGLFCDFDGCLAPIVDDPDRARAVRGASTTLARLARRFRVVAIVSGRSAGDLARRLRVPGVRLVGLHGIEEVHGKVVTVVPEAEGARGSVERAAERLRKDLRGVRGAVLEHKGLALAVHFRRALDPLEAERIASPLVVEAAAESGLAVVPGRRILEVRPMEGGDKGNAIKRMIESHGLTAGLVGGDDVGDLPAFAAVDGLDPAIRVAVASAEAPLPLVERADVVLGSPKEFVAMLRGLERRG